MTADIFSRQKKTQTKVVPVWMLVGSDVKTSMAVVVFTMPAPDSSVNFT